MNTKRPRYHPNDGRFYQSPPQQQNVKYLNVHMNKNMDIIDPQFDINSPIVETSGNVRKVVNSVPAVPKQQLAQNRNLEVKDSDDVVDFLHDTQPAIDRALSNFKAPQNKNDWISLNQNHPNSPNNRRTDQRQNPPPISVLDGFRNFLTGMGKAVNQVLG